MDYYFSKRISGLAPSAIREILKATQNPDIIPLAAGNPDVATFPMEEVKKILAKHSGKTPVYVVLASGERLVAPENLWITPDSALFSALEEVLGRENVKNVE